MTKATIISFDGRLEAQKRLSAVGGSIVYKKGQPKFSFPTFQQYQEYLRLGADAHQRKVASQ